MRVLLAPHGTRGDIQPMLALALGLRDRGNDVTFLAPNNFVEWIRGYGFRCEPDGVDVEAALQSPDGDLASLRWQMRHFKTVLIPALFESFMRIDLDVDLIVAAGVQLAASSAAEWKDIPYASVAFCPAWSRTALRRRRPCARKRCRDGPTDCCGKSACRSAGWRFAV